MCGEEGREIATDEATMALAIESTVRMEESVCRCLRGGLFRGLLRNAGGGKTSTLGDVALGILSGREAVLEFLESSACEACKRDVGEVSVLKVGLSMETSSCRLALRIDKGCGCVSGGSERREEVDISELLLE